MNHARITPCIYIHDMQNWLNILTTYHFHGLVMGLPEWWTKIHLQSAILKARKCLSWLVAVVFSYDSKEIVFCKTSIQTSNSNSVLELEYLQNQQIHDILPDYPCPLQIVALRVQSSYRRTFQTCYLDKSSNDIFTYNGQITRIDFGDFLWLGHFFHLFPFFTIIMFHISHHFALNH